MGTFATDAPRPNGDDSDNTLLYKIANRLWSWLQGGTAAPVTAVVNGAANGVVTKIPTGATQIAGTASLPARATRASVLIRCLSDSPETCYFGYSSGVNASTGMPLQAGESVPVQNAAQIFFFSAGGTATIACAEDYN